MLHLFSHDSCIPAVTKKSMHSYMIIFDMIHVDAGDTVAAPQSSSPAPSRRNNKWGNEERRKSGRRRGSQELARHDPRPAFIWFLGRLGICGEERSSFNNLYCSVIHGIGTFHLL